MLRHNQLDVDHAMVMVIDMQEKLLPLIGGHDHIVTSARKLLEGVKIFGIPVAATEQYPQGLGPSDRRVREALVDCGAKILEKSTFSAWAEDRVRQVLLSIDRPQVIVAGIETHVCVRQTALDLVSRDYDVFVCADAVGSRGRVDHETALDQVRHAGVNVTTVEGVLFELCQRCDTQQFKAMIKVIKDFPPAGS